MRNDFWVEKYRPRSFNDYKFYDKKQQTTIQQMVESKNIPHLLFSGNAGTGKTTLARLLIDALEVDNVDVLELNSSDDNGVDVVRSKIKNFVATCPFSGTVKIVHLNEFDYMSANAQGIMRVIMEDQSSHVRFILTCNYIHKVIPEIISRCQHFEFQPSHKDDIAEYVASILISEKIKFDLNDIDLFISDSYPDIRRIVNNVQKNSVAGKLSYSKAAVTDYSSVIESVSVGKWIEARTKMNTLVSSGDWEDFFRFMYSNVGSYGKFKTSSVVLSEAIIIIAEHLYKHAFVADPEINATAMIINLAKIAKE